MKKIAFFIAIFIITFIFYNAYADINAIKNSKIEIYGVKIEKILPYIVLNIGMKIINNESRNIKELEGHFEIFILNISIGKMKFGKINVVPYSSKKLNISLIIYYDKVAESIIEIINQLNFNMTIKGKVRGKILFGLIEYEKPFEAIYRIGES